MRRRRKTYRSPLRVDTNEMDTESQRQFIHFASTLISAREEAENEARRTGQPQTVETEAAIKILNEYPQIRKFLQITNERELAREEAMALPDDFLTKASRNNVGSPTQHNITQGTAVWGSNNAQPIGVMNARILREWADSNEICRAAINVRRVQIGRADIMVAPLDSNKPYDKEIMQDVQLLLDQPNELRDSYRSLIEPVLEDILVLDRGVISKNMDAKRIPHALYAEDGSTIKIYPAWSGDPNEPRYLYEDPNGSRKVPLRNDQAIVIMMNTATYRYGLSPMAVLQHTIRADLKASQSASHMVDMKPPPSVIQIPGISASALEKMKAIYDQEVSGRKEILFLGGPTQAKVFPLVFSAKDNQWLEWQEYLSRKICAVFQISPQQLGITFDINRATGETQQQIFEDTGLIPLLLLLEEFLNRELLADFAPPYKGQSFRTDLAKLNLRIVYPEVSEASRQYHYTKTMDMAVKGLAGLPSMTINQVLKMRGDPLVKGGNTFYVPIGQAVIPVASYDNELGVFGDVMVGEQDPSSGPRLMRPPEPTPEKPGRRRVPDPGDTSPYNPDNASDESGGSGLMPHGAAVEKSYYDGRPPGRIWSVRHIQREE